MDLRRAFSRPSGPRLLLAGVILVAALLFQRRGAGVPGLERS